MAQLRLAAALVGKSANGIACAHAQQGQAPHPLWEGPSGHHSVPLGSVPLLQTTSTPAEAPDASGASCATTTCPTSAVPDGAAREGPGLEGGACDSQFHAGGSSAVAAGTAASDGCDVEQLRRAMLRAQAAVLGAVLNSERVQQLVGLPMQEAAVGNTHHSGAATAPVAAAAGLDAVHVVDTADAAAAAPVEKPVQKTPDEPAVPVEKPIQKTPDEPAAPYHSLEEVAAAAVALAAIVAEMIGHVTGSQGGQLLEALQPPQTALERAGALALLASVHMPLQDFANSAGQKLLAAFSLLFFPFSKHPHT